MPYKAVTAVFLSKKEDDDEKKFFYFYFFDFGKKKCHCVCVKSVWTSAEENSDEVMLPYWSSKKRSLLPMIFFLFLARTIFATEM